MRHRWSTLTLYAWLLVGCAHATETPLFSGAATLPPSWTETSTSFPSPTINALQRSATPAPTSTKTTLPSGSVPPEISQAPFEGAEQWWLTIPDVDLISATGTKDGGAVLMGRLSQKTGTRELWIMRLNPNGAFRWQKTLQGVDYPSGILETNDGGILVLEFEALLKLDSEGDFLWQKGFRFSEVGGYAPFDPIQSLNRTTDGVQILGIFGMITTLDREGFPLATEKSIFMGGGSSEDTVRWYIPYGYYVAEQDSRSIFRLRWSGRSTDGWERSFDFSSFDITLFPPEFVYGTKDGGALLIAPAPHVIRDGGFANWLVRVDRNGDVLWQRIFDAVHDYDFMVSENTDGGFIIAARSEIFARDLFGSFLRLTRINSSGNLVWDRLYGDGETKILIERINESPSDDFLLVGKQVSNGDTQAGPGISLLRVDQNGKIPGCVFMHDSPFKQPLRKSATSSFRSFSKSAAAQGAVLENDSFKEDVVFGEADARVEVVCRFPPAPPPPTPTPLPSPTTASTDAAKAYAIAAADGALLGGVQGGVWLDAEQAAALLPVNTDFKLYDRAGYRGETQVNLIPPPSGATCPELQYIEFLQPPGATFQIALQGGWEALPRTPTSLSTEIPAYQETLSGWLRDQGLHAAEISIHSVVRVDLTGDGTDEVLLAANRYASGLQELGVAQGDYSVLLLRQVVGSEVQTIPLYARTYPSAKGNVIPWEIVLLGVFDMNGDGRMEIMARANSTQGFEVLVFDSDLTTPDPVLRVGCGE